MSKYRNIPQATKDNVLHYVNQVYDEAYELGYQRGIVQSDRDIKNAQQMIEDAIKNLRELKQEPKRGEWIEHNDGIVLCECSECHEKYLLYEEHILGRNYCPNCGADMRGDEE